MRTENTFGVHFIVRLSKAKNGKAPIYARITVNQKRCELALKRTISSNDWNGVKGLAKPKTDELRKLNSHLEQIRGRISEHYHELQMQKKLITAETLKNLYLGVEKKEYTICSLMSYHNTQMVDVLAKGTLKNYFTTEKYIKKFLEANLKKSDIYLSELNYQFITEFELFLRRHKPTDHQKPIENNGVMKHLERLRKLTNLASKMEWMDKDPFDRFELKFQRVDRGHLTKEELAAIEEKKFSLPRMQLVKDLFVFSCYTGLAYIDLMMLTRADIGLGIDGGTWIKSSRQKSDISFTVPLLVKAQEILKKYEGDPRAISNGTAFPSISNQKLNSYLKELADICGINKNFTFHLARHTFATTVTLSNGVPIETVSKMLGHTKITTTQIYAKVVEQKISEDMFKLSQRLGASDTKS